ncbi:MAG: S8 family serine peptidase [Bacteroidia bacterium]|nr:S8 family serine peptidase [Bacteroidia bacterium]
MMKQKFLVLVFEVLYSADLYSARFFIRFTDKNNSLFSISTPQDFLSQKAIIRRTNQNIAVVSSDLPVNSLYIDSVTAIGATILSKSKWLNGVTIECDSSILQNIIALPFVSNATQVRRMAKHIDRPEKKSTVNPMPYIASPAMMRVQGFDYGSSFNQIHLMNGEYLHDQGFSGEGMTIAVLDAGFFSVDQLAAFDSIRSSNRILGSWDFVDDEPSVYEDNSHGMSVLSCIAGNVPGQLIGTAPRASFWLLRSEDAATEYIIEEYNWVAAAEFADSVGADLITSSLGYTTFDDSTMSHTYADMNGNTAPSSIGADIAASKGMLILTSAGNSGNNTWYYISAPSDGDSVLSVAAVDEFGFKASFSSWGPSSDGDVKPNIAAKGAQTTVADAGGGISTSNGTSFACPVLAGSAACLWQAHPDKTNMEIFDAIQQSANYYLTPGDSLGYGIPNFIVADLLLGGTMIERPDGDELIGVYPNPFDENIEVKFFSGVSQQLDIEVLDGLGRLVSKQLAEINRGMMNTVKLAPFSNLQQGIYFMRITTSDNQYLKKIIKY